MDSRNGGKFPRTKNMTRKTGKTARNYEVRDAVSIFVIYVGVETKKFCVAVLLYGGMSSLSSVGKMRSRPPVMRCEQEETVYEVE